jgi:hypothetical protein
MRKRNSKLSDADDVNVLAHEMVQIATDSQKGPAKDIPASVLHDVMSAMGKRGGRIGGKRRLETMSPAERSAAALKAARARWKRKRR